MLFQGDIINIFLHGIVPLIMLLPAVFFCINFSKKYFNTKYKMFGYLSLFFITYLLSIITTIISFYYLHNLEISKILFITLSILEILVFYSIIILLEVFEKDIQFSKTQIFLTIFAFLIIGGLISTPPLTITLEGGLYSIELYENSFLEIAEFIFSLVSFILLFSMLYRSRKTAWSSTQKHLIKLLSLGIFLAIFMPIIPYVINIVFGLEHFSAEVFNLGGYFIKNVGMFLIGFTFFQASKKPWLLQRQNIHILLVYSEAGIQLYSKIFGEQIEQSDSELLTGAFSAISSLLKQTTKTSGYIETIILEGRELKIIKKEHFLCALLVDYTTQASDMAHKNFTNDFEKQFSSQLEHFIGEVSIFKNADAIVRTYFFE